MREAKFHWRDNQRLLYRQVKGQQRWVTRMGVVLQSIGQSALARLQTILTATWIHSFIVFAVLFLLNITWSRHQSDGCRVLIPIHLTVAVILKLYHACFALLGCYAPMLVVFRGLLGPCRRDRQTVPILR
jgi:hypothetical protein